ncbi:MAG TPA: TonB-dependent receptor, partial [Vicinamibacterales bacterium]|nr:TonB-dependent receptor [Vicinamibacterales bacterium]
SDGRSVRGDYGYYRVRQIATTGDVSSNNFGFWVQDSWTVNNNLTINAGLRTENENVPSYSTGDGIKFGFREKMAPRIGFAYDVQGNNKWKLYGSYGKFFDITKLSLPIGAFGGDKWVDHFFTLDTFNWPTITCADGVAAEGCTGGTKIESVDMRFNSSAVNPVLTSYFGEPRNTIDPDLKPYETGELTFGMDHELNRTMSVGVRYVHKWLVRAIEDVGVLIPEIGEVYFISNPGFGISKVMDPEYPTFITPKADRDYDSVEFRLRKRMADRWSFEGTYVWSYLRGNYSGLASSDEGGRTDPNVSRYFDAPYMSYDKNGNEVYGRLYTDRPHQVKLTGTYDMPWGTSVGVSSVIQSGLMPSSLIYWNGYDVYYNGRGDMARTPTTSMFDMMLQHDFRLFKTHRINVHLQIDNVFDQKGVTDVWQRKYRDNFYGDDTFYGGFDPDALAAKMIGNNETQRLHPLYGQPYSYQAPRAMRLGVKYTF